MQSELPMKKSEIMDKLKETIALKNTIVFFFFRSWYALEPRTKQFLLMMADFMYLDYCRFRDGNKKT